MNLSPLSFDFDPHSATFSLASPDPAGPHFTGARFGLAARVNGASVEWNGAPLAVDVGAQQRRASPHGELQVWPIWLDTSLPGLRLELEFARPPAGAWLMWRATLRNVGELILTIDRLDLLRLETGSLTLGPRPGSLAFYSDGYQSWSFAGVLTAGQRQPPSLFGPLGDPKRLNLLTPAARRANHFTSEMFGLLGDRQARTGLLAGFLSQREQFGCLEVNLDGPSLRLSAQFDGVSLAPGQARPTDWAYLELLADPGPDWLGEYAQAAAREHDYQARAHAPVGWCSWYHYFDRVTEQNILDNAAALARDRARLPLEFVQIDDGFQAQVGDWFETKPTFPHGLAWLTEQIRANGQTPGLWLAPYIVRSDARLLREHPDWFIHDRRGRPASAGYNWFRWCYGLDPTHPGVREHTDRLIRTAVREWGFPYLKLDFLYAAALPGRRYDPSLTRAQGMRLALRDIRAAAGPEVFLLGCGCPLGSAIGLVDGMRISTDVAPDWQPQLFTPLLAPLLRGETEFVSARNAVRNTLHRAGLHRRWWLNDPDCLLVRDQDTRLTEAEVRALATVIGLSGGMFLLSDDLTRMNPARLRYARLLLPVLPESARAPGWLEPGLPDLFVLPLARAHGAWTAAGIFNWEDQPRDRTVRLVELGLDPGQTWLVSDFWDQRQWRLAPGEALHLPAVPAHGAHLLALRPLADGPQLVGSSFHFSQGGEISAWEAGPAGLRLTVSLGRQSAGELRLRLPHPPRRAEADGKPVIPVDLGAGLYGFAFEVQGEASLWVDL